MRILHLADLHLDRPFVGLPREAARQRRHELRAAFRRCLEAAHARAVDLVTIGGDLWEDEHVTPDTRGFVADELRKLELPVFIICGNHDPLLPGGNYERTAWPRNVHLFTSDHPVEQRLDGVSLWGVSWRGGPLKLSFLETFRAPHDGRTHLLLLHGTAQTIPPYLVGGSVGGSEERYGPFDPAGVERCGFALCLAGHVHGAYETGRVLYPGSPEPLGWKEMGRHCYALVEATPDGVTAELVDVNHRRYAERPVDCEGASSSSAVAERIAAALDDPDPGAVYLRLDLVGQVGADCQVDVSSLVAEHGRPYAALVIRDRTRPAYDLDVLARQLTAAGEFVRSLRERIDRSNDERERETLALALEAGLNSLHGRRDVIRVD